MLNNKKKQTPLDRLINIQKNNPPNKTPLDILKNAHKNQTPLDILKNAHKNQTPVDILKNNPKNKLTKEIKNMYIDNNIKIDNITNSELDKIYNNITNITNIFKNNNIKNILFICSDSPGYGGAATNCMNLSNFFNNDNNFNSFTIFWNWENEKHKKNGTYNNYTIINQSELINTLKNIKFKPDIIILKNTLPFNIKTIVSCPILFLIPGIYKNTLNEYYYLLKNKKKHDKYININTLNQIRNSDYSLCNSLHTREILTKYYNLDVGIFYTTFVPYYKQKIYIDNNFEKRKYRYGLIVSDFSRKIKNIEKSIQFLKGNADVILIGKGSSRYKSEGFTCIEFVDMKEMENYYKQIQYIVQDSYYESCSNVMVESIFNSCLLFGYKNDKILINFKNFNKSNITICKNQYYIIGNINYLYDNLDIETLFTLNKINSYVINNNDFNNIIYLIYFDYDCEITYIDLLNSVNNLNHSIQNIGFDNFNYSNDYIIELYFLYGYYNITLDILNLNLFYNDYVLDNTDRKFNKTIYMLCYAYFYGQTKEEKYKKILLDNLNNDNKFHNESVLLISKYLYGYGGVQKSSLQIIKMLDLKYNVFILSNYYINNCNINTQNINVYFNVNNKLHNSMILKMKNINDILYHINNSKYKYIVNNKLNEFAYYKINKKIIYIVHNSMDPLNQIIINNKSNIDKVLTINNFHKNLLIKNGFKNVKLFKNYTEINNNNNNITKKTKFNYSIAFIGRISEEKNVQLLINSILSYNNIYIKRKITLYIIGDGKLKLCNIDNINIKLLGRISFHEITKIYNKIDYVISSSLTEGKPFSIIEAMSFGIPCIHSNINGIDEIINNTNGFVFDFFNYNLYKNDMSFENIDKYGKNNKDIDVLIQILHNAYNIDIDKWNELSNGCINFIKDNNFTKEESEIHNMYEFEN